MFHTERKKLTLLARNEGKIKSYESCLDLRAWSHDIHTRDRYFREWIKCDMPICVIPVCTVASFLRTMTWRGRGRGSPRCHPDCKSKMVLDSICTSCHAMKQSLRNDEENEKYFDEEEFETAHWPCERCLDALKTIKMMWKVIIERIFKISLPKSEDFDSSSSNESVQTVAKAWQEEMLQQTLIVKKLSPCVNNRLNLRSSNSKTSTYDIKRESTLTSLRKKDISNIKDNSILIKVNTVSNSKHKSTETDDMIWRNNVQESYVSLRRKISRCTSFRLKTLDWGCDACDMNEEEFKLYKNELEYLRQRLTIQNEELKQLKGENFSLKLELRQKLGSKSALYTPFIISETNTAVLPQPFEACCEEQEKLSTKNVDSEIVITLKNLKHEKFRKVSLLQVLHKTNGPVQEDLLDNTLCNKHEDPIKILSKVQDTFGAIVKREMRIANKKRLSSEKINIDASYHKMSSSRSNLSCFRMSSHSSISDSIFESSSNVL